MAASRATRLPTIGSALHSVPAVPTTSGTATAMTHGCQGTMSGRTWSRKVNPDNVSEVKATSRPPSRPGMATPGRRTKALAPRMKPITNTVRIPAPIQPTEAQPVVDGQAGVHAQPANRKRGQRPNSRRGPPPRGGSTSAAPTQPNANRSRRTEPSR
jgi:hypothetical protein